MEYRSFDDLSKVLVKNIEKIPKDIDLIVGIPRSGLLVANIVALLLNKPLTDLAGYEENRLISCGRTKGCMTFIKSCNEAKKVLVIEDSVWSGKSIIDCKKRISLLNKTGVNFIYACVYMNPGMENVVDFYFEKVKSPRIFEWNIFHHPIIEEACFDIDGVLCVDPTISQNDNGDKYKEFLSSATAKIIPSRKIGALVTSRLSTFENETRDWMRRHCIDFDELIMMDCTFEERQKKGNHAEFKASFYKKSKYKLFIESEPNQAIIINQISKKPVYCVGDGKFYDGTKLSNIKNESSILDKIKKIISKFAIGRYILKKRKEKKNEA